MGRERGCSDLGKTPTGELEEAGRKLYDYENAIEEFQTNLMYLLTPAY